MQKLNQTMRSFTATLAIILLGIGSVHASEVEEGKVIRIGLIGLDTSHVIAFSNIFNDPKHPEHVPGAKIVAGVRGGSPNIEASVTRVDGYTKQLQEEFEVKIVDSIPELCEQVDAVMITSVAGLPKLKQAKPVIEAGLPFFLDKPIAGSFEDALEIARLAKKAGVPWFGGSSLRWWSGVREALDPEKLGEVLGCDTYSPCAYEEHHPDIFWYGVHGVSILYAAMGKGCKTVSRTHTEDADVLTGVWEDGRIGTFRGTRKGTHGYGGTFFGTKAVTKAEGHSYRGLLVQVEKFFRTGQPPLDPEEMVEMYAFMQAADDSKAQGGKAVPIPAFSLD